ncbi:hypothetical protein LSCM1_04375 [Leishmania martiniquensis]|uniref:Uncharacterized protein n=1 Tax=Leishmania martiniquensis TaxID=1580590 RepID=A0A836GXJ4_9TRYP|nr:hypothetical protein LSCM1_04375 [Leishmania martiniquensis]
MGSRGSPAHLRCSQEHDFSVADPVERFVQALEQFIWQAATSLSYDSHAADGHLSNRLTGNTPTRCRSRTLVSRVRIARSLESALSAAAPPDCGPRGDSVIEAGLYLLRLTHVLERRVLDGLQQEMHHSMNSEAALPLREAQASATSSSSDMGKRYTDTSTIRRRGRRYTVPGTSLPLRSSAQSVDLLPARRSTSSSPAEGEVVCNLVRYHAELTLGLQQSMLWCICQLDTGNVFLTEEDGGGCGVLTPSRAARVQWLFLDAIVQSVTHLQQRWREGPVCAASVEAVGEASVVLDRLGQAAQALRHPSLSPQLQVFEVSGSGTARRSPPPFTSWQSDSSGTRVSADAGVLLHGASPQAVAGDPSRINGCLGVVGAGYAAKLAAQQLWIAQELLSQRFPAHTAAWEVLERARFFVESARSPTPTVPRSDSLQQVAAHVATPSRVPAVDLESERPHSIGGSTTPPCVAATQRKSERPYDLQQEPALPSRGLTFSEERAAVVAEDASSSMTHAAVSESRVSIESTGGQLAPSGPSLLLPVARCALWDNFLATSNLSPTATLLAIQHLAAGAISSPSQSVAQRPRSRCPASHSGSLSEVPVNKPGVRSFKKDRPRDYSSQTEPCYSRVGALVSVSVHEAHPQ